MRGHTRPEHPLRELGGGQGRPVCRHVPQCDQGGPGEDATSNMVSV